MRNVEKMRMHERKPAVMRIVRHIVAIAALCVFAVAGIAWGTEVEASPGPRPAGSHRGEAADGQYRGGAGAAPSALRVAEKSKGESREPLVVKGKILRGKLNLNTATVDQLRLLPGIGAAKARRILDYRTKRGKFQRVRDLRRVKGVGYKTLKKLSPYLAVQGQTTLRLE